MNRETKYRLGNRTALEWVVDQYQVSTDKLSGITKGSKWVGCSGEFWGAPGDAPLRY
jgi:predicted helicase